VDTSLAVHHFIFQCKIDCSSGRFSISELVNMLSKENVVCFGVELKFVKAYYLPHQFVSPQNEFILQSILHFTVSQLKLDQAHNHGYVLDPFVE